MTSDDTTNLDLRFLCLVKDCRDLEESYTTQFGKCAMKGMKKLLVKEMKIGVM